MQGSGSLFGLVPLITAGFLFVVLFYRTRFAAAIAEGQKLFFMCAAAGLGIGALAFPFYLAIVPKPVHEWVARAYPLSADVIGPLFLSLLLAPATAIFFNVLTKIRLLFTGQIPGTDWKFFFSASAWNTVFSSLAGRLGSPLQQLLVHAINNEKLVIINLTSRKVYCGTVLRLPPMFRSDDQFIEIIPVFSSSRDKNTLALGPRLDYPVVQYWRACRWRDELEALIRKDDVAPQHMQLPEPHREQIEILLSEARSRIDEFKKGDEGYLDSLNIADWSKIIPIKMIESASIYDEQAHKQWFSEIESTVDPKAPERADSERDD